MIEWNEKTQTILQIVLSMGIVLLIAFPMGAVLLNLFLEEFKR